MQVVPMGGTGDGTVFRKAFALSESWSIELSWRRPNYQPDKGLGCKMGGVSYARASCGADSAGQSGSGTLEQNSKIRKGQLSLSDTQRSAPALELTKQPGKMPHGWGMLDVSEIRDCSNAGLGAVPNELSSAKENLPVHRQFSVSLQSVAQNNVSGYWIRYLSFSFFALEYEEAKKGEKYRSHCTWTYGHPRKSAWLKNLTPHILK